MNRKARIGLAVVILAGMAAAVLFLIRKFKAGTSFSRLLPELIAGLKNPFKEKGTWVSSSSFDGQGDVSSDPSTPLTLKVECWNGLFKWGGNNPRGQATMNVGETKTAFTKFWWMVIGPQGLWAIAKMNLTRTDSQNVVGALYLQGIRAWTGQLLLDGVAQTYVKNVDVLGYTVPAVTIKAWL